MLADVVPTPPAPPEGVEIISLAEQPERARGIYDLAAEDCPMCREPRTGTRLRAADCGE
jgi:hypothetical protein